MCQCIKLVSICVILLFTKGCDEKIENEKIGVGKIGTRITPSVYIEDYLNPDTDVFSPDIVICEENIREEDQAEYEMPISVMVREIVAVWDMFFDDEGARPTDYRRNNFQIYAESLAKWIHLYQNFPTDIGGQLPRHRNIHILFATMVTLESSVTHDVVGPGGEVGLLQVMPGPALAGHSPRAVRYNYALGLRLGVRWLASRMPTCGFQVSDYEIWDDWNWSGPLSVYAAGQKAIKKNGECVGYSVAKKRIRLALMYRSRIDHSSMLGDGADDII